MSEEINKEELEFSAPVEVQADTNDLPVIEAEEPVEAPAPEESAVVEEAPAPKPKTSTRKKSTKKSTPKVEPKPSPVEIKEKAPGMYHKGRKISAVPARLGNKWTVIIDGKRHKVLKKEIEIVK